MGFDLIRDQEVDMSLNLPNLHRQLEMIDSTDKDHPSPLSRVMG